MNIKSLVVSVLSVVISFTAVAEKEISHADKIKMLQVVGEETNLLSKAGAGFSLKELNKPENKMPPFAVFLKLNGELGKIGAKLPFLKNPKIGDKVSFLRGQLKNLAEDNKIKAGAIFTRGYGRVENSTEEVPGLIVEMEHRNGPSTIQFVMVEKRNGVFVALDSTSNPKPPLFFNHNINSDKVYDAMKQASSSQ